MCRSGLVDTLVTYTNTKEFDLTSFSGVRCGFMPSQLKTKRAIDTFFSEILSPQCDLPLVNLALNLNTLGSTKLLLGLMIGPHPLHVFRRRFLGPFESGAQWNKFFKICSKMIWQFSKGSILIFRFFPVYHSNQCFAAYLCINNNKSNDMTLNNGKVLNHSASSRSF